MSYKIYTDKKETFECKIFLEGASLTNAKTRIIVETDSVNLMYNGKITADVNCTVPINKLNSFLKEGDKGNLKLEVIAEDTYFLPWESDFVVNTSKKIKVEVKGQEQETEKTEPITENKKSKKPKMVVTEVKHPFDPVEKVVNVLHKQGVGVSTIYESKKTMIPMLKKYSTKAGYKRGAKNFIKEVIQKLSKK